MVWDPSATTAAVVVVSADDIVGADDVAASAEEEASARSINELTVARSNVSRVFSCDSVSGCCCIIRCGSSNVLSL